MPTIEIDTERAQVDAHSRPDRSVSLGAKDEKERFKAILLGVVKKQDGQLIACLPHGDYPLMETRGQTNVMDWALSEYIEQFDANGKQVNYKAARADIRREMGEPAQAETNAQGEQEKRGRGRPKSKLSEEDAQALYILRTFAEWQEDGSYPGSLYLRVPPITDTRGLDLGDPRFLSKRHVGEWYLPGQDKPPVRLLDVALYYTDVTYPHASAQNKPYTGMLRAVNWRGEVKEFPFTGAELRDRENNKFKHFAKWPQDIPTQSRLLNCMEALFTGDPATIWHEQVDTLGYVETQEQGLIHVLPTGIEGERGYIPNEKAPIVGPELLSPGNGYQGTEEKLPFSDDIYKLVFEGIEEEDQIRIAAKMGALMYAWFPPGTVEKAGRLPFYMETVGSPSCGKTPEDNFIKSHDGIGFRYDSPPFLTLDDTKPSAPARMQIMKHLAYSDDDRKCSPGSPGFHSEHARRTKHINYLADGQGAGSRYYDHATRIASRGEPQGMILGTSNYDHAIYALSTPGLDEDAVERRAETFVVKSREVRTEENSRAIFARTKELYAMGRAVRAWLMHEYNRDKNALRDYIQDFEARADAEMQAAFPYDWSDSKDRNHCRIFVWGILFWLEFLKKYGAEREQGYLYQKLSYLLPGIVEDRAVRSDYLDQMIKKRDGGADLGELCVSALSYVLGENSHAYIVGQNGEPLTLQDIPSEYGLNSFGYFHHTTMGAGAPVDDPGYVWDHPKPILGNYMKRKQGIAVTITSLRMNALLPYIRATGSDIKLPDNAEIKEKLLSLGVLVESFGRVKYEHCKIDATGRAANDRILIIPLDKLSLPGRSVIDEDEETEKSELLAEVDNVVSIEQARADRAGSSPASPAQAERVASGEQIPAQAKKDPIVEILCEDEANIFDFDPYA